MRAFRLAALGLVGLGIGGTPAAAQMMDNHIYTYVAFDELEYVPGSEGRPIEYEGQGWIGGDYTRLWLKARGEQSTRDSEGDLELQALYSRTTSAFWNTQAGVRLDHRYGPGGAAETRALAALGLQGLAPYWFELEAFAYVSHKGDVSARVEASYDLLVTQRVVLEPAIELNASVQDVPEFGLGSGLTDIELGARLRYEVVREFAPYIGVSWLRRTGATADLAKTAGAPVGDASLVAGLRWWY